MRSPIEVPAAHAASLRTTLDAVRGETEVLKAAGLLSVSADDLLDGGGTVNGWIADLSDAVDNATTPTVALPLRDPGMLQHIVYGMSSVLVWANELRREGRTATTIPVEAVAAWSAIERAAGLGGRTAVALVYDDDRLVRPDEVRVEVIEATATAAA